MHHASFIIKEINFAQEYPLKSNIIRMIYDDYNKMCL